MIIELFGLPGSGKSYFATQASQVDGWSRVDLPNKVSILGYFFRGFINEPMIYCKGLWLSLHYSWSPYFLWNFYVYRYAKYAKALLMSGFVVLDEGPLQNVISYPHAELSEPELKQFLLAAPAVEGVVAFDLPRATRLQYMGRRGRTSWRQEKPDDHTWDVVMEKNTTQFLKLLETRPGYYVINDDASVASVMASVQSDERCATSKHI